MEVVGKKDEAGLELGVLLYLYLPGRILSGECASFVLNISKICGFNSFVYLLRPATLKVSSIVRSYKFLQGF